MLLKKIIIFVFLFSVSIGFSQKKKAVNPSMVTTGIFMGEVAPLKNRKLVPRKIKQGRVNPKMAGSNKVVPGKGLPKGKDQLLVKQKSAKSFRKTKAPELTFKPGFSGADPSDPTGAIGPNHYVSALNSEFAIHDRNGNVLVAPNSLANIWQNETLGDPIVFYDNFADRFVITQFDGDGSNSIPLDPDNGFLIAISKGPDPVNDGWFTYRFRTGNTFPDYPKFSVWSDGYYITTNKNQGTQDENEVIYVIERDKIIKGISDAKMVGFPLPGSRVNGFYSPASFNAIGNTLPPAGDSKIIYLQDDSWEGVSEDALKLWTVNVDWVNPNQSTIVEDEVLNVSGGDIVPFDSVFDGGSFRNIPQPNGGVALDTQQAVMMYATNYRRFCDYNSVVLNFAVDIDDRQDAMGADIDNISGIRWYELRQNGDGQPWTVYQEGTYTSPDGKSAWCASMAMDIFGNIGMGYTTMGTIDNGATADSFASIRYTGRLASDPLGTMTFAEEAIVVGTGNNNTERYGDYAQITVDPVDNQTFWHIAEYFEDGSSNAQNIVGAFKIANSIAADVGVIQIDSPGDATLTNAELITVTIQNFGSVAQTNVPVSYTINGGAMVTELFAGPINPGETMSFSFATSADLTAETEYNIAAETGLTTDSNPENDCTTSSVRNLLSNDLGIVSLITPGSGGGLSSIEPVSIRIFNFGGLPQSGIPVFYTIDGGAVISETFEGTIASQESAEFTFTAQANLPDFRSYEFEIGAALDNDQNISNNSITVTIEREFCKPTSDCAQFRDGITSFELANVSNTTIECTSGYEDFTSEFVISLDRLVGTYTLTVQSGFANDTESERLSLWIDFNDDGVFEDSELLLDNEVITAIDTDQDFSMTIANDAPLGRHLLRIRGGDVNFNNGAMLNDPCGSMDQGTTHDYTVDIVEGLMVADTDLIVVSNPGNQFRISKVDANAPEEIRIYIFNLLGQVVASNVVKKNTSNTFVYDLDMSFAKSGIYFARLGDKKNSAVGFMVL